MIATVWRPVLAVAGVSIWMRHRRRPDHITGFCSQTTHLLPSIITGWGYYSLLYKEWPCEHKSKSTKNLRVCDGNHYNNILNILFTCSSLLEKIVNVMCSANKFSSSAVWDPVWTCLSVVSHILLLPLTRICVKIEACYSEIICGTKPELPHLMMVIQKLP